MLIFLNNFVLEEIYRELSVNLIEQLKIQQDKPFSFCLQVKYS